MSIGPGLLTGMCSASIVHVAKRLSRSKFFLLVHRSIESHIWHDFADHCLCHAFWPGLRLLNSQIQLFNLLSLSEIFYFLN